MAYRRESRGARQHRHDRALHAWQLRLDRLRSEQRRRGWHWRSYGCSCHCAGDLRWLRCCLRQSPVAVALPQALEPPAGDGELIEVLLGEAASTIRTAATLTKAHLALRGSLGFQVEAIDVWMEVGLRLLAGLICCKNKIIHSRNSPQKPPQEEKAKLLSMHARNG
jgi:hypothetical protein